MGAVKNVPRPDFLLNMQTVIVKNIRFRLFLAASGGAKSIVFSLRFCEKTKKRNGMLAVEQYEIKYTYRQEKDEKLLKFLVLFS